MKLDAFDELVACFEKLPGVGKKSALRYAYFVSLEKSFVGLKLSHCIEEAVRNLQKCKICGGLSEDEICEICADETRQNDLLCIVENPRDILILENNKAFDGKYFVLDNLDDEILIKLKKCIQKNSTNEIIFALTPSINNDAIMLFIEDKLSEFNIKFSKIAQGIPTGVSLENVDSLSLNKAVSGRVKI